MKKFWGKCKNFGVKNEQKFRCKYVKYPRKRVFLLLPKMNDKNDWRYTLTE